MHDRGGLEEFVEVESPSQPSSWDASNTSQDIASPQDVSSEDADSQIQEESTKEGADAVTSNGDSAPDGEGEQVRPLSTEN